MGSGQIGDHIAEHTVPGAESDLEVPQDAAVLQGVELPGEDHGAAGQRNGGLKDHLGQALVTAGQVVGVIRSLIADPLGDGGGDAGQLLHLGVEGRGVVPDHLRGEDQGVVSELRPLIHLAVQAEHIVQAGPQKFAVLRRVLQVVLRHGQHQGVDRRVHGLGRVGLGGDVAVDLLHREVGGGRLLLRGGGAPKRESEDGQDRQGSQKLFHSRPLLSYLVWT